jgi:hypothetical protein
MNPGIKAFAWGFGYLLLYSSLKYLHDDPTPTLHEWLHDGLIPSLMITLAKITPTNAALPLQSPIDRVGDRRGVE